MPMPLMISILFGAGGSGGEQIAFAGSAVINTLNSAVISEIATGARINQQNSGGAAAQSVQVRANHDTDVLSVAGSVATSTKLGIGAAADVETIDKTVQAIIGSDAVVNAKQNVILDAQSQERMLNITAGFSGSGNVALAGSATIITLDNTTQAFVGDRANITTGGSVAVSANSDSQLLPIAGAGGFGGSFGFGVSNTTIVKTDLTEAKIGANAGITALGNSVVNAFTGKRDASGNLLAESIRGVSVTATSREDILAITAGAGVSTGTAGVAGSAAVNILNETTRAIIDASAQINSPNTGAHLGQTVNVLAVDDTMLSSVAGALAYGSAAGIGAGVDVATLTKTTEAVIEAGATVNANNNVLVQAFSTEDITSVSAALGGSIQGGIAGSAGVSVMSLTTQATIGNAATVTANGNILVNADDETEVDAIAGSASAGGSAGIGASVTLPIITKHTAATVGSDAVLTAKGLRDAIWVKTGEFTTNFVANSTDKTEVEANGIDLSDTDNPASETDSQILDLQRQSAAQTQSFKGVAVTATNQDDLETYAIAGALMD